MKLEKNMYTTSDFNVNSMLSIWRDEEVDKDNTMSYQLQTYMLLCSKCYVQTRNSLYLHVYIILCLDLYIKANVKEGIVFALEHLRTHNISLAIIVMLLFRGI
jgi:hypothetical protein